MKLTIKDTAKVQKGSMTDEKEDTPPTPPQTGDGFPFPLALAFVSAIGYAFLIIRSKKVQP